MTAPTIIDRLRSAEFEICPRHIYLISNDTDTCPICELTECEGMLPCETLPDIYQIACHCRIPTSRPNHYYSPNETLSLRPPDKHELTIGITHSHLPMLLSNQRIAVIPADDQFTELLNKPAKTNWQQLAQEMTSPQHPSEEHLMGVLIWALKWTEWLTDIADNTITNIPTHFYWDDFCSPENSNYINPLAYIRPRESNEDLLDAIAEERLENERQTDYQLLEEHLALTGSDI